MSTPTDLENRISAALAARAEQVRPEHISPTLLPAAAVPRGMTKFSVSNVPSCPSRTSPPFGAFGLT